MIKKHLCKICQETNTNNFYKNMKSELVKFE